MNRNQIWRQTAIAAALSLSLAGVAMAQSTTGTIFGSAPVASGETVTVANQSGVTRTVSVGKDGRFSVASLPVGVYSVTLMRDGKTVGSRENVAIRVGAGTEVSFPGGGDEQVQNLSGLTVTASSLPAIDVSGVDSRTVITAQQLATLPLARSAESIALLAPGAVQASAYFTGPNSNSLVSLGGSSVTENAYYINGFNTTDPLSGFGGLTLPYGAIDQEEILNGGYGAAYGRSDGGVINMVGKRGTNEWHFGAQVQWTPAALRANAINWYNPKAPNAGTLYDYRQTNNSWQTTYDAYAGGPLIKDKLFLFAAVEVARNQGSSVGSNLNPYKSQYRYDDPKWYVKADWNINENNVLELTGASNKTSYRAAKYDFDYDTLKEGAFSSNDTSTKTSNELYSAKFTSYITDNLTLTALYGEMKGTLYSNTPGYDPTYPHIFTPENENPALNGGSPIQNANSIGRFKNPDHTSKVTNLRLDLSYSLGDHTISAGIDNITPKDINDGTITSGPGYAWEYNKGNPSSPIVGTAPTNPNDGTPYVAAPGGYAGGETGYYVARYIYQNQGSVRVAQKAQYIEDSWQINDRWLVKLGLRNDQFTNYNSDGVPYLRLTSPQLAPRLGFSWDVNGDSSFKVYGNAGRYYLALPASVALRAAGASLFTREYFTYTGIDANGIPQNLTPIESSTGGPISSNLEYGIPRDPKTAAAKNLQSEYQDEFILGFDKQLNESYVYGAKATFRNLRRAIDDVGDAQAIYNKMIASGIDPATIGTIQGSYLFNPGQSNTFLIPNLNGGYYNVTMTNKDFGFNTTLKRKYTGLELYLMHPFDGKWFGKLDYVWSHSYGNSEGQVRSDIGQTDVSATVDWDYAQVMDYANGDLSNDRRHVLKAYGSYQLTSEVLLSGNLLVASGSPKTCLGYYGADQTNPSLGYGPYYHFCGGKPYSPGAEHNPWEITLSLGATYRPEWAGKNLAFSVDVFNVFDRQNIRQTRPYFGDSRNPFEGYQRPISSAPPRSVRLGVSYDF